MASVRELLFGPVGYLFVAVFGVGTLTGLTALTEMAVRIWSR